MRGKDIIVSEGGGWRGEKDGKLRRKRGEGERGVCKGGDKGRGRMVDSGVRI